LRNKIYFGETRSDPTPRGYTEAAPLFTREAIRQAAGIVDVRILSQSNCGCPWTQDQIGRHWFVVLKDQDGICWATEYVGAPLLQRTDGIDDATSVNKFPERTLVTDRGRHIQLLARVSVGLFERTVSDLIHWMMLRNGFTSFHTENCKTYAADLFQWMTGRSLWRCVPLVQRAVMRCAAFCETTSIAIRYGLIHVNRVVKAACNGGDLPAVTRAIAHSTMGSSSNLCRALLSRKVFFGETWNGATPRGYSDIERLIALEGINPDAVIQKVRVYSGDLEGVPQLTHFFFAHWWLKLGDSEGHWWAAENVGTPLLQRTWSRYGAKYWRKDVATTQFARRSISVAITRKMKTDGRNRRRMRELLGWLLERSALDYHAAEQNCQHFGSDLCHFLTGIGVLHTDTANPVTGAVACIPLSPFWWALNVARGALNSV
jgi:hypothetical protein